MNMNKKLAFTIAEALMSMLILSIFIGVSMRVFTKKHTKPVYNPTHGFYMCYRGLDNNVYQQIGSAAPTLRAGGTCEFTPVKNASYYVIYATGGGGGGNAGIGGAPADFQTLFVTNIADNLEITPGRGGTAGNNGESSFIRNTEPGASLEERLIVEVPGGLKGGETRIKQSYVRSCNTVPLATLLNTSTGRSYLDNNHDDTARCEVTATSFKASLCPHSHDDIRQENYIKSFYQDYARNAVNAANNWPYKNYDFTYGYDGNCIIQYTGSGSNYEYSKKYCIDHAKGDKLYYYNVSSHQWYLAGLNSDGSADCLTETLNYNDITINNDTDSFTVIRAKENGKFKYIIDLQYDLTKRNVTTLYKESGFGDYIESSSLRDANTAVLYHPEFRPLTPASRQFDPSAGDGGANGRAGIGGAVFIAW